MLEALAPKYHLDGRLFRDKPKLTRYYQKLLERDGSRLTSGPPSKASNRFASAV